MIEWIHHGLSIRTKRVHKLKKIKVFTSFRELKLRFSSTSVSPLPLQASHDLFFFSHGMLGTVLVGNPDKNTHSNSDFIFSRDLARITFLRAYGSAAKLRQYGRLTLRNSRSFCAFSKLWNQNSG